MLTLTVVDLTGACESDRCVIRLGIFALHINLIFYNFIIIGPKSFPIKAQVSGATSLSVICVLHARSKLLIQNLWQCRAKKRGS